MSVARQISHRHVCRVYDIGDAEGFHFISMEYVRGETLSSLLKRIGRLPEDKARTIHGVDPETVLSFQVEKRGAEYWAVWGKKAAA